MEKSTETYWSVEWIIEWNWIEWILSYHGIVAIIWTIPIGFKNAIKLRLLVLDWGSISAK